MADLPSLAASFAGLATLAEALVRENFELLKGDGGEDASLKSARSVVDLLRQR
jgi:hypothetical protein